MIPVWQSGIGSPPLSNRDAKELTMASPRTRPLKVGLLLPDTEGQMDGATPRWADLAGDGAAGGGGRVRLALGDRPLHPSQRDGDAGTVGVLVAARRPRRRHRAGRDRPARHLHRLPQPGAAGQDGRHRRRDQRRPADPRASAPAGTSRSTAPSATPSTTASTRFEEALTIISGLLRDGHVDFDGHVLPGARLRAAPARSPPAGSADHDRHHRRADARPDRPPRRPVERLVQPHGQPGREHDRRCRRQVDAACAAAGRDPATLERTAAVDRRGRAARAVDDVGRRL